MTENLSLYKLYIIKEMMEEKDLIDDPIYEELCKRIIEDGGMTSATGGPAVTGGMGAVVNAQPSGLAGATIGTSWASHGGTTGSGDISVPYNPSGSNRVFQSIPSMGYNHGARTGKKSRNKKLNIKNLKNIFSIKQDYTNKEGEIKEPKIMSFQNFLKNDISKIKK